MRLEHLTCGEMPTSGNFINRIGEVFGQFRVIGYAGHRSSKGAYEKKRYFWFVSCTDCGAVQLSENLKTLGASQCGKCLSNGNTLSRESLEYQTKVSWRTMKKNHKGAICPEWKASYETFVRDVGIKPAVGMCLVRKDDNDIYRPGNVEWVRRSEQKRRASAKGNLSLQRRSRLRAKKDMKDIDYSTYDLTLEYV